MHSLKLSAPSGLIMNSCISKELFACAPPFIIFIIGIGSVFTALPPINLNSGVFFSNAAFLIAAIDTAKQVNKFFTTGKSEATKPDTVVEESKSNEMVAQGGDSKYFSLQYGGDEVSEVGNKVEDKVNESRIPVKELIY